MDFRHKINIFSDSEPTRQKPAFDSGIMKCPLDHILASGANPFDKAYHQLQHKFDHHIVKLLSEILNLNLSLVTTPLITDLITYQQNPDNWILEQLINGTADMSSTTVILTPESSDLVNYSHGIGTFRPQLYYKARSLREDHNIYLTPFSPKLWISLIAAIFLLTLTLTFILSREAKLPHEVSYDVLARIIDIQQDRDEEWTQDIETPKEVLLQKEKWEIGEILLVCLGAICQQGAARDPSTSAARLLLLVFFLLTVVGYTAYSASIISLISMFPSTESEQTGDPTIFSRQYKSVLHNTNNYLKISQLDFQKISYSSIKTGLESALKGEAAFIGDRDVSLSFLHSQNYSAELRCQLGRVFLGMDYHRVLAFKTNFKYKENINFNILRLKQFGLLDRERRRIFNTRPPCTFQERASQSNFVSFDQNDVEPVVNLFKLGLITSVLLLIAENIIFYCPKELQLFFNPREGSIPLNVMSRQQNKNYKMSGLILKNKVNTTNLKNNNKRNGMSFIKSCFSKRTPRQPFLL